MKYTDSNQLEIGKYYCIFLESDSRRYGIIHNMGCGKISGRRDKDRIVGNLISNMNSGKFDFKKRATDTNIYISGRKTIPATWEQIQWLDECVRQNKFVPFEDVILEYYEIY